MTRTLLSTTVDATLLAQARSARAGSTDAALVDEALSAPLLATAPPRWTRVTWRTTNIRSTSLTLGRPGLIPAGGRGIVSDVPARGDVWWCEMAEIAVGPSWFYVETL